MSIDFQIHETHVHYNGFNYFRGCAEKVSLGDVGEKKTPATQTNYLDVTGRVMRNKLEIRSCSRIDLHSASFKTTSIGLALDVHGKGNLTAGTVAAGLKDETLSLVQLRVLGPVLVKAANAAGVKALTPLKTAGNNGRIVSEVFIVAEAKSAAIFTTASSYEVGVENDKLSITFKGGKNALAGTKVSVAPGTVYAYALARPIWNANLQKNWTEIVEVKDDQWSLY